MQTDPFSGTASSRRGWPASRLTLDGAGAISCSATRCASATPSPTSFGEDPCPPDQREEDEAGRMHQVRQLSHNVQGLLVSESVARAQQ